jgi:hypothetical protein
MTVLQDSASEQRYRAAFHDSVPKLRSMTVLQDSATEQRSMTAFQNSVPEHRTALLDSVTEQHSMTAFQSSVSEQPSMTVLQDSVPRTAFQGQRCKTAFQNSIMNWFPASERVYCLHIGSLPANMLQNSATGQHYV